MQRRILLVLRSRRRAKVNVRARDISLRSRRFFPVSNKRAKRFGIRNHPPKAVVRCASQHTQAVAISKVADPSHKNRRGVWQQASHGACAADAPLPAEACCALLALNEVRCLSC